MEKRMLLLVGIPVVGVLVVATLIYFWLAPDVASKIIVYLFCLGILLVQGSVSSTLWHYLGAEKATPTVVSGSAFALGVFAAGCVILVLDAPFRIALYFLAIFSVLYVICVGYLSCMAADELWSRAESTIVEMPSIRNAFHEWLQSMKVAFQRRRPGETDAERHVRNNREIHASTAVPRTQARSGPPPLPGREE